MTKKLSVFATLVLGLMFLQSCTNVNRTMRQPNVRVELERTDFEISEQFKGEASTTKILGIDWQRLRNKEEGSIDSDQGGGAALPISIADIPVIGGILFDRTSGYALYNIMQANPGYDVVFYPQFTTTVKRPFLGLGFIYKTIEVKATTRLAKLKQ